MHRPLNKNPSPLNLSLDGSSLSDAKASASLLLAEDPYDQDEDENVVKIINTTMPDKVESSFVDSLIAKQMSSLSMKEREQAYFDIHGISSTVETPEMIQQAYLELDQELSKLGEGAYRKAEGINPSYVRDERLRLKFLRADRFDAKKAALRMARHFEAKLDLFGASKLCQDITQNDLKPGDLDSLVTCVGHLPIRDSVGRLVRTSFWHNNMDLAGNVMKMVRAAVVRNAESAFKTQTDSILLLIHSLCIATSLVLFHDGSF